MLVRNVSDVSFSIKGQEMVLAGGIKINITADDHLVIALRIEKGHDGIRVRIITPKKFLSAFRESAVTILKSFSTGIITQKSDPVLKNGFRDGRYVRFQRFHLMSIGALIEQITNRVFELWVLQIRYDLGKWFQHEPSLMKTPMGKLKFRTVNDAIAVEEQININVSGTILHLSLPSHLLFDLQTSLHQRTRVEAGLNTERLIQKFRLIFEINRLGFVNPRRFKNTDPPPLQAQSSLSEVVLALTNI